MWTRHYLFGLLLQFFWRTSGRHYRDDTLLQLSGLISISVFFIFFSYFWQGWIFMWTEQSSMQLTISGATPTRLQLLPECNWSCLERLVPVFKLLPECDWPCLVRLLPVFNSYPNPTRPNLNHTPPANPTNPPSSLTTTIANPHLVSSSHLAWKAEPSI